MSTTAEQVKHLKTERSAPSQDASAHDASSSVDITVLVCTFNRATDLRELLTTALAQETGGEFTYEILVVDNNSADGTRAVVEELIAAGHKNLRYLFEGQQGRSNALNTGLSATCAPLCALADDDLLLPPDYLQRIFRAFAAHPEVSFVGGKVLPSWRNEPPTWLTSEHWSAIAMADYGATEFYTDEDRQVCLLAGAFRVAHVQAAGGYHRALGVSKGTIGGTEDVDLLARLWRAGRRGLYLPGAFVHHKVEPERTTRRYHRRWHTGNGRHYAMMRLEDFEQASARLFDVPAHLYRQTATHALAWLASIVRGDTDAAFLHETRLRFFRGFFTERRREFREQRKQTTVRDLVAFLRTLASRNRRRDKAA